MIQRLTLPDFPHPVTARTLSPNGRAHWRTRNQAVQDVHEYVWFYAKQQHLSQMRGRIKMYPKFVYPNHRKRDDDNLATGILKAARDCLVRGGWLAADDMAALRQMPVEVSVEKGRRELILEFELLDPAS